MLNLKTDKMEKSNKQLQEENKKLLDALKTCVARLRNEIHAPFAIVEAEEVIKNVQ